MKKAHKLSYSILFFGSIIMMLLSIYWLIMGKSDPFGFIDHLYFIELNGKHQLSVPLEYYKIQSFMYVPLAATIMAYFLIFAIVSFLKKLSELWVWNMMVGSLVMWYFFDSLFSVLRGVEINAILINTPAFFLFLIPCLIIRYKT